MKKQILYILSSLLLFVGCTTTTEGLEREEALVVLLNNVEAECDAESVTIKVISLASYEVKSTEVWSWITPSKKSGERGISELKLNIKKNTTIHKRNAIITIQNLIYNLSHDITITQKGEVPAISISKSSINSSAESHKGTIIVTSNIPWTASCSADWVTLSQTKGEKGKTALDITIKENAIAVNRTATVEITNSEYNKTATITVEQGGYYAIIYTSSDGKIVTPYYTTDVFGANIVSNTYRDGQGIIIFDAPVTSIGDYAFKDCTSLTSVTIPNGVTSIGSSAFYYCTSLTSVTIPDSVTSIEYDAFHGCDSLKAFYGKFASSDNRCLIIDGVLNSFAPAGLTQYTIPDSVTSIGYAAFYECSSLTSVTIPNSVTSIEYDAFHGCTSLTSVIIGNSVTSIGEAAFAYCYSLTSVTIPDSVTSIGSEAFENCFSLKSITIPDSVTSIEYRAFYDCTSLTSVIIGNSVTSIGEAAFAYCYSLTSVYCKPTTPPAGSSSMFSSNASGRKIYVPTASVEAYKAAKYWSNYAYHIIGSDF